MKPLLIACDFDGTITCRDTLHVIVEEFGVRGVWDALEPRLRSGEMTVEEAMTEQFAAVRATAPQVLAAVRRDAPVRRGFPELVAWARAEGHRVVVLSSGFRTVIEAVLGDAGVGDLAVHSNDVLFGADGCTLVWADRGDPCPLCGRPCKRHDLAAHRGPEPVVYVGDGVSDRCAARAADLVFARDGLAAHLGDEGVPFVPFDDFDDVRRELVRAFAQAA
ncbi:MAG: MtnX-like HAD-IB family phosphatase [Actinomycetota bacterium]